MADKKVAKGDRVRIKETESRTFLKGKEGVCTKTKAGWGLGEMQDYPEILVDGITDTVWTIKEQNLEVK